MTLTLVLSACSGSEQAISGTPVRLEGIDSNDRVDDLVYSPSLGRLIVPALGSGIILVDPETSRTTAIKDVGTVHSVAERDGIFATADRNQKEVAIVQSGKVVNKVRTRSTPDYVRFVPGTDELWVSEPGGPGIEIFRVAGAGADAAESVGFIKIKEGVEGLTIDGTRGRAYTHSSHGEILVIDMAGRTLVDRWPIECSQTHGIPALDEKNGLLLAGCGSEGEGVVLDVTGEGRIVGRHSAGGGEALLGFSAATGHFYLRGDPGENLLVLQADAEKVEIVGSERFPRHGHCLGADDRGNYWTCDLEGASVVRFDDSHQPQAN